MTIEIQAIKAFSDNYIWMLVNTVTKTAACIDPGDANPVIDYLAKNKLTLTEILITHHHMDHIGGVAELAQRYEVGVFGSSKSSISQISQPLSGGESIYLPGLAASYKIIYSPGHTLDHICYYGNNTLFCGDTLFAAGCGRLFEGTPQQMYQTLMTLRQLPDSTLAYCAHEYTLSNLLFAQTVEPDNKAISQRLEETRKLRQKNIITIPFTLKIEKETNPFLRCGQDAVKQAASHYKNIELSNPIDIFATIRQWKNNF